MTGADPDGPPAVTAATVATEAAAGTPRWGCILPASVDDVFDRPASVRAMALLRIALGPIVLLHLRPFLADTAAGVTFRDHYFEPWLPLLAEVPGPVQVGLVWVGAAAAVAMMAGWWTRAASVITLVGVAGNFFLSQTYFRHNRAFLIILLAAIALSAAGKVLSVDARRARRRARAHGGDTDDTDDDRDTAWPLWTLRALVSTVYFASGFSKLVDPDWVGGLVLWDRSVRFQQFVSDRVPEPVAEVVVDVVTTRWVHTVTSPIAVAIELFVAFGLWFARTRLLAVWVAITFHLSIELSASVEVFSIAAIAALVIWATPSTRDRVVTTSRGGRLRRLDWLGRFDIQEADHKGLSVVDRDGTTLTGADARAFVLARLPLTFFVAAPWWAWRVVRRRAVPAT